jgi:redox-sensitive bicupin YhaK (pirin superfamily)
MGSGVLRAINDDRMRAGTGVCRSEYNAPATAGRHLLQIWTFPTRRRLRWRRHCRRVDPDRRRTRTDRLALVRPELK